jgi:hypothetical protein
MAAPNDPKDKSKVTLDLDLKEPIQPKDQAPIKTEPKPETRAAPQAEPRENTQLKFRQLDATVKRPDKQPSASPGKPMRPTPNRSNLNKRNKPRSSSKTLFGAAAFLIAGALLYQYFGTNELPFTPPPPAVPPMAAKAGKNVPTEKIARATPAPEPTDNPYAGLREVNLSQLTPEVDDDGNTFFSVRVAPKPVCHPADIEAMRNVVGQSGSLVISLEPMADNGKSKGPISRTVSLKELSQGVKFPLPVNPKETGVYGIYICSDQAGKRSCGGKPAADFNKIFNHSGLDAAANAVFYYQFAVLGLDYATVYAGAPANIVDARQEMKNRKSKRDWKAELDKAANMMTGVKSFPPRTVREGRNMVLELPVAMVNPDGSCR